MSTQAYQPPSAAAPSQDANLSGYGSLVSTIIYLFSSSGPCGDWLKLVVIGGILEVLRRFLMYVWRGLVNQFWITLALEEYDDTYSESDLVITSSPVSLMSRDHPVWMMLWLSEQPAWTRAKELSISTHSFGVGARAVLVEGEDDDNSQRKIRFLPSFDCSASLWYRGHYLRLTRNQVPDGPFYVKETLTMRWVSHRFFHLSLALIMSLAIGSSLAITRSSTNYCSRRRASGRPQRKNSSRYTRPTPRTNGG